MLLCNLHELYTSFKEQHPNSKIGLSKFCSLRPNWCVTVSASGTCSVCVCISHQNTKLIADGFTSTVNKCIKELSEHNLEDDNNVQMLQNLEIDYKKMMQMIVCDTDNMECMVHCCEFKMFWIQQLTDILRRKIFCIWIWWWLLTVGQYR